MWYRITTEQSFGRTLADIRRRAGMTQDRLAERTNTDRTTLVRLESGRLVVLTRITKILSILGYDLLVVPRGAAVTVAEVED